MFHDVTVGAGAKRALDLVVARRVDVEAEGEALYREAERLGLEKSTVSRLVAGLESLPQDSGPRALDDFIPKTVRDALLRQQSAPCFPVLFGSLGATIEFVEIEPGIEGLVHISEIDRNYVKDVHDHLREGDVVQAKVQAIKEDGKIDLSIKALQDPAPVRQRRGSDPEFEQMLKKFMKSSEERLVDYKRAVEHKRK